jgi:hypothetical protein
MPSWTNTHLQLGLIHYLGFDFPGGGSLLRSVTVVEGWAFAWRAVTNLPLIALR